MHFPADREPSAIRYVKLGSNAANLARCRELGRIELDHRLVPHDVTAASRWDEAKALFLAAGYAPGVAQDFVRELRDFYELDENCLWITFGDGRLHWAFAEKGVQALDDVDGAARSRTVRLGWSSADAVGKPLLMAGLAGDLLKVAAYRRTICGVRAADYLLRRLRGGYDPLAKAAREARTVLIEALKPLIQALQPDAFELFVSLLFERSGWRRISAVGGVQADFDMLLEQPAIGETAFVQVKSSAKPAVFTDYLARFRTRSDATRFFFVCHSPQGAIPATADPDVHIWLSDVLAERALDCGLAAWLIDRPR